MVGGGWRAVARGDRDGGAVVGVAGGGTGQPQHVGVVLGLAGARRRSGLGWLADGAVWDGDDVVLA